MLKHKEAKTRGEMYGNEDEFFGTYKETSRLNCNEV